MTRREKISRALLLLGVALFAVLWMWKPTYSQDEMTNQLLSDLCQRGLGALIFLGATLFLGYRIFNRPTRLWWLAFLPALLVVINNFPIIGLAIGEVTVDRWDLLPLYLLDCLMIGAFEEIAFRGTIFIALLEKRRKSTKQIFWVAAISSALFGLLHLTNLIDGAGIGPTLLQVGYSFLIGGMCSIVFLKCRNILPCILLHTLFDIGGRMVGTVASGRIWNLPTVIVTAVLGVAVAVWMLCVLWRVSPEETDVFFANKPQSPSEETPDSEEAPDGEKTTDGEET